MNSRTQPSRTPAILLIVCAGLVIAGSLGPWAKVGFFTVSGTNGDGVLSLIAGTIAGIAALVQTTSAHRRSGLDWLALICLVIACGIGIYDWANVNELAASQQTGFFTVQVGWGLPALTIFGFIGATIALEEILYWGSRGIAGKVFSIILLGPMAVLALIIVAIRGKAPDIDPPHVAQSSWPSATAMPVESIPRPNTPPVRDAFCRQCGAVVEPGDMHCGQCGHALGSRVSTDRQEPSSAFSA